MIKVVGFEAIGSFFMSIFNNVVTALVLLLIGFIAGRIIGKMMQKLLHEVDLDKSLKQAGVKLSLEYFISRFIMYSIYFLAIILALEQLGINTFVFSVIALGIVVVIIISLVLAIKDFVPNLMAGLFIHRKNIVRDGDKVDVGGIKGVVVHVNLFETKIRTKKGETVFIPNSTLVKERVVKKN